VLDEPTTGLHLEDVAVLLQAIGRLVERGHGVLAVEHHLDVMAAADLLVDLGPEGGPEGGAVVATGTPEEVARGDGHTGRFLRAHLEGRDDPGLAARDGALAVAESPASLVPLLAPAAIEILGARE